MNPEEVYKANLEGGTSWSDIARHLPMLRMYAHGNVFEIGTRSGISTAALIMGVRDKGGHVWSLDIADCSQLYNVPEWTFLRGHSIDDAQEILRGELPSPLDVLFIDSDHTYDTTLGELRIYGARVRHQGGVILLHDTDLVGAGVRDAISTYSKESKCHVNFADGSYGLGILTWDRAALDPAAKEAA
jgi:predicted O-methyltransferase YrrM